MGEGQTGKGLTAVSEYSCDTVCVTEPDTWLFDTVVMIAHRTYSYAEGIDLIEHHMAESGHPFSYIYAQLCFYEHLSAVLRVVSHASDISSGAEMFPDFLKKYTYDLILDVFPLFGVDGYDLNKFWGYVLRNLDEILSLTDPALSAYVLDLYDYFRHDGRVFDSGDLWVTTANRLHSCPKHCPME